MTARLENPLHTSRRYGMFLAFNQQQKLPSWMQGDSKIRQIVATKRQHSFFA
jgi:hypothetical protein